VAGVSDLVMASDNFLARPNKDYALEKLSWIDRYGAGAINATATKPERHFLDLSAGPGRNVDSATGREFEGAAIRVAQLVAPGRAQRTFTHEWCINIELEEHKALEGRLRLLGDRCRVPALTTIHADANVAGPRLLHEIAARQPWAYALVFADPANPSQLPWATVQCLGTSPLRSVDFYVLMPLDMGITRMIPTDLRKIGPCYEALTTYFGTEEWWPIVQSFGRVNTTRPLMREALLKLYIARLKAYWPHVDSVRNVRNFGRSENHRLYRMLFCTRHSAGVSLAKWERTSYVARNQLGFDLGAA
jgi:three-Cys-motif partner protein